jgi:transposase-like protein
MSTYTAGFKARMVQRMAGPESLSATALAKEVGISQNTLSRWLRQASEAQPTVPPMTKKKRQSRSTRRTAQDKLRLVLETSALSEEELGAFLRREGVHEAELEAWRTKAMEAAEEALKAPHGKRSENTAERRRVRDLERELTRKDKALAEVSALLILKKKVQEIWGDEDDATGTRSGT